MNIEKLFLEKAIKDRNFIDFIYKNNAYKSIKPLQLHEQELKTDQGQFLLHQIKKLKVQKNKF